MSCSLLLLSTPSLKARWRAAYARHMLHIEPCSTLLVLGPQAQITADALREMLGPELTITTANSIATATLVSSYDYIVGEFVPGSQIPPNLKELITARVNPGGGLVLFAARNIFSADVIRELKDIADTELFPYDVIPDWLPSRLTTAIEGFAFLIEHSPLLARYLANSDALIARKTGGPLSSGNLTTRQELKNRLSVVVPCHNEEMNIEHLLDTFLHYYSDYVYEIVLVDDNSTDNTAEVISDYSAKDKRVKLLKRKPPNGVGLALRDGYRATSGDYVLSMDCDFVEMLPELRDLFNAVADGADGAIGSRFSYQSVMVGYPFSKMLCNRIFHWLMRLLTRKNIHDITNNLKIYRGEILRQLEINESHFSANLETGLKPILLGHRVVEVPASWINRRAGMGQSSFRTLRVGPPYTVALLRSLLASKP